MKYKGYTLKNFEKSDRVKKLPKEIIESIKVVGKVLPFKSNNYVVDELINWDNFDKDPLFTLTFPKREMLDPLHYKMVETAQNGNLDKIISDVRSSLNPHPSDQVEKNVPLLDSKRIMGIQHKYRETMLVFPSKGQQCHAFCTFCFRWPQFSGMDDEKFALKNAETMVAYLKKHPEITDLLITGGDPMIMKAKGLKVFIDAVTGSGIKTVKNIRIGSKTLSFWPYRYLTDSDSSDILDLFRKVTDSGYHLSFMAHLSHINEMKTDAFKEAVKAIQSTGAVVRTQSPILRHINDDSAIWKSMWEKQVGLGMIPYYMFIARNTGAHRYFSIPLVKAYKIFKNAYMDVSGIARTVRGPSMSSTPGKITVDGIVDIKGEKALALSFIQGRDSNWVKKPFFAEYNEDALWIDDLTPAFGESEFFFNNENFNCENLIEVCESYA